MAKRLTTEDHLAALRQLRAGEPTPSTLAALEQLLRTPRVHGIVIKGAAELAYQWEARALIPALAAAAETLAPDVLGEDAPKRDPGAEAKEAILRALVDWEADLPDLYLKAARWEQFAPIMHGRKDVAAECRGLAALGIAQTRGGAQGPDAAVMLLIDLLADPEAATRVRVAQALGLWRGPEGAPVLRLKAHVGDEEPQVLGEVLAALLRHDPRGQLPFVEGFLHDEDSRIVEAAALALGESRLVAALPALAAAYASLARDPVHTSVLMAIALLRHEDSLAWLLARLADARPAAALEILESLRLYKGDEKAVARIAPIAHARPELARLFDEMFT
jgi:hypothetical protein